MYNQTRATTPSRHADRASYDAESVHQILDEALLCHVAFVADELPQVLPMLFVRLGSVVFVHSSTGAQIARKAAHEAGTEVALETTIVDALVLARSAFNHSANYRSVVVHGRAALVRDAEVKQEVLEALMEKLVPGRTAGVRGPTEAELRQTALLALPLVEVSAKIRSGPPVDEPEDLSLEHWAGLWPLRIVHGTPQPSPDLSPGIELPAHLLAAHLLAEVRDEGADQVGGPG
jgi:nitroimidazol reductase NimA-like FMN-containing flavoprotein (pyridoxamine 5'-phosphate oxidase superfamily)